MDTNTERKTIRQIAEAVAPLLGEGWTFEAVPNRSGEGVSDWETERGQIVNGVHRLYFHNVYRDKDKIHISGEFPKMSDGEEVGKARRPYNCSGPWHSICVSHFKEPAQIAKDIKRRLLPDYMALMVEVLAQREEIDDVYNRRDIRAEQIAKIIGVPVKRGTKRGDEVLVHLPYVSGADNADIVFYPGGDMDFKLRITNVFLAKAICELIAAHRADYYKQEAAKNSEIDNG